MDEIRRLQDNLLLIRKAAGWTAEDLGDRIGVTRQTINNLEAGRNKLNKTQYIAIRAVLDAEMTAFPEDTEMLACLLEVLIDNPDRYSSKDKEELLQKANMLTPSILAGTTTRKEVSNAFITSGALAAGGGLSVAQAIGALAVGTTSAWLIRLIKALSKKK